MSLANELTAELLIAIPRRFPRVRIWRNNRLDAVAVGKSGKLRRVQAGINGQGDISGIAGPSGKRIELEIKIGKDRMSDAQKAFRDMILKSGGLYIVARSVEQCLYDLELSL